jgi:uncharacterized protein
MPNASLEEITGFLQAQRLAVVGVSRDPKHFSRALFREFLAQGYDPVPVNLEGTEIEGRSCFARIADIDPPVEAALLMTSPAATDQVLAECNAADIRNIWIYRAVNDQDKHRQAVESCQLRGAAVIEGYCPFMFLPKPGIVHRVHRLFMKVAGSYPL